MVNAYVVFKDDISYKAFDCIVDAIKNQLGEDEELYIANCPFDEDNNPVEHVTDPALISDMIEQADVVYIVTSTEPELVSPTNLCAIANNVASDKIKYVNL